MRVEKVLYFDPQQAPVAGFCERCGGCMYLPSLRCIRCERGKPRDPAGNE